MQRASHYLVKPAPLHAACEMLRWFGFGILVILALCALSALGQFLAGQI